VSSAAGRWGILTDRDVLRCAAMIDDRTAGNVASGGVLLVRSDDRRTDVAERMLDQGTSQAFVVEPRTDGPVGALSTLSVAGILGWGRC
jgi:predicted transcriptional regulator